MALHAISQEDLATFHATHFSAISRDHFSQNFLGPVDDGDHELFEDDGLGYYGDGIKRTLTDEQIAIFRHSEIHGILQEQRQADERRRGSEIHIVKYEREEGELEDGRFDDKSSLIKTSLPLQDQKPLSNKERKALKAKQKGFFQQKGFFRQNIKPDLRKRTWDKVDIGLSSLEYDEVDGNSLTGPVHPVQRQRISYDDA